MAKSSTVTVSFPVEPEEGDEFMVFVEATFYPGCPAVRSLRNGDPGYPEEPPSIDILSSVLEDGTPYDLSPDELEEVEQLVGREIADNENDYE